jgi:hypothetical protein
MKDPVLRAKKFVLAFIVVMIVIFFAIGEALAGIGLD